MRSTRTAIGAGILLVAFGVLGLAAGRGAPAALAQAGMPATGMSGGGMMGGPGMMGGGGMMMAAGWITMLLFWALVIVGIVALVRWIGAQGAPSPRGSAGTALEILKRRYASGEITKEQYESMKRDIV